MRRGTARSPGLKILRLPFAARDDKGRRRGRPRRTSRTPPQERLPSESVTVLFGTLEAGPNLVFRFVDADPRRTLDRLSRLEVFVDAEEVLDLE